MPAPKRLPLFLAFCPDKTSPGTLERRLSVRAQHLELFAADKAAGRMEFGRGFLPRPGSEMRTYPPAVLPPGTQPMAGSVMLLRAASLDAAWARLRRDPYWTAGVWDDTRVFVEEFVDPPPGVECGYVL
ncbi:hypothetical protein Q5752_004397 [Cryptotrichosporon argae]